MTATTPAAPAGPEIDDELDERRLTFTLDQISAVRWQVMAAVAFVAILVWEAAPTALTLGWVVLALAGRELRVAMMQRLTDDWRLPMRQRLRRARWSILAVSVPQGATAGFMIWLDQGQDAILTMILVSLSAGATSTSALVPGSFLIQSSCLLVPTALFWLASLDRFGIGVGVLILLFLGVQNRFARFNMRTFEESFRIRRENDELMRQLAQARDRAEAASHAKTRFLAAASHDLRQPLHALSLQSAALALDLAAEDSPRLVRTMSRSIEDLSALLDSLLDISKLDAGTMKADRHPIRLSRLVRSAAEDFRALAAAKGLRFDVDCPAGVVAVTDALLLERLLRNLIDNAVKYTAAGGVSISLDVDRDWATLRVDDSGCGIAPALQSRVFEEFYQVDSGSQQAVRGLGLGLSIVRRLAELLGLALRLESEPGRGTRVSVRVPLAPVGAAAGEGQPQAPVAQVDGLRVLVVDDDPAVREATCVLLRRLGCTVDAAADGDEALAAIDRRVPAVVITDYRLRGGETGLGLAQRLRAGRPDLPLLLVSGDTAPDRLQEAAASELPMLHKPLSADRLRAAIAAAVRGSHRADRPA